MAFAFATPFGSGCAGARISGQDPISGTPFSACMRVCSSAPDTSAFGWLSGREGLEQVPMFYRTLVAQGRRRINEAYNGLFGDLSHSGVWPTSTFAIARCWPASPPALGTFALAPWTILFFYNLTESA